MDRVGFIGSPQAGSVARQILNMGQCSMARWQPDDVEVDDESDFVDLEELADVPLIVVSTGIGRCRQIARMIGDVVTGRHILVHTIRGLEEGTLNTASRIFYEETPTRRIGFVTGPMRLDDLQSERPASAVCASEFPEVHDLVEEAMMSPRFRVYHTRDLYGAELAAIYGRLVAVMSGLADGLGLGASLQATLFARGLAEMSRFVSSQGGREKTPYGLAGAGNLYVDTLRDGDIDFNIGRFLADSSSQDLDILLDKFGAPATEIADILTACADASRQASLDLYLLEAVESLILDDVEVSEVLRHLMTLPSFEEEE